MGLGKTLTMIALILAQKKKDEKLEEWISKNGTYSFPTFSYVMLLFSFMLFLSVFCMIRRS